MTEYGRLPLRLLSVMMSFIALMAGLIHLAGALKNGIRPARFIIAYVEIDLYYAILNFVGSYDASVSPSWMAEVCGLVLAISGWLFWGMFIALVISKHLETSSARDLTLNEEELQRLQFNGTAHPAAAVDHSLSTPVAILTYGFLTPFHIVGGVLLLVLGPERAFQPLGVYSWIRLTIGGLLVGSLVGWWFCKSPGTPWQCSLSVGVLTVLTVLILELRRRWAEGWWS